MTLHLGSVITSYMGINCSEYCNIQNGIIRHIPFMVIQADPFMPVFRLKKVNPVLAFYKNTAQTATKPAENNYFCGVNICWRSIPANVLTTANLCSGLVGIVLAFDGSLEHAGWAILVAAVFDFLDGFAARLLRGQSDLGKQLDSLADLVSFGVLPGVILFQLINATFGEYYHSLGERNTLHLLWSAVAAILPVAAALRLAKFNIDTKQTGVFLGLPTPAGALVVASYPIVMTLQYQLNPTIVLSGSALGTLTEKYFLDGFDIWLIRLLHNPWLYIWSAILLALLEVSRIPMVSFKFKKLAWKGNQERYVFLAISVLAAFLATIPYWTDIYLIPYVDYAMSLVILFLYIAFSLIIALLSLLKSHSPE